MCGRFEVNPERLEIKRMLNRQPKLPGMELVKTGEIRPSDVAAVLVILNGKVHPKPMSWGFPKWDGKGVIFNARSETAIHKAMFRRALLKNPIVVPTTGFYEWKAVPGKKKKEKYKFNVPGRNMVYLAGFYNTFKDEGAPLPERFTILTMDADEDVSPYHSRMPVVLDTKEVEGWIKGWHQIGAILRRKPVRLGAALVE